MGLAEQGSGCRRRVGAHQPIGAAILEAHLLQPIEIAQQFFPFRRDARLAGKIVEIFLHGERQERTEHMTADGRIGRMENRPWAHDGHGSQEKSGLTPGDRDRKVTRLLGNCVPAGSPKGVFEFLLTERCEAA